MCFHQYISELDPAKRASYASRLPVHKTYIRLAVSECGQGQDIYRLLLCVSADILQRERCCRDWLELSEPFGKTLRGQPLPLFDVNRKVERSDQ